MKKALLLCAAALLFSDHSFASAAETKVPAGKENLVLDSMSKGKEKAGKKVLKGPVPFAHQAHVDVGVACSDCHHKQTAGETPKPCHDCHKELKGESPKESDAFHSGSVESMPALQSYPAAGGLQLEPAHRHGRLSRLPDRRGQAGPAGRLRPHPRLRVPEHRAQRLQLLPAAGHGDSACPGGQRLDAASDLEPVGLNPDLLTRTIVAADFRSPFADQFSLEAQRQMTDNLVLRVGYVGTRGHDLYQTLDGNPNQPFTRTRVNPSRGVIRLRDNTARSWYNSLQVSVEKHYSKGFSAGFHYTYSKFIDTASEIFNVSSAEVAVAQDSFDIAADKGRSSFDRPHRFTGNFVWELPVMS